MIPRLAGAGVPAPSHRPAIVLRRHRPARHSYTPAMYTTGFDKLSHQPLRHDLPLRVVQRVGNEARAVFVDHGVQPVIHILAQQLSSSHGLVLNDQV